MDLEGLLAQLGATRDEIDELRGDPQRLRLEATRRSILPEPPSLTAAQVAAAAGVDEERARELWRAMGFAEVPEGTVAFTRADVEALRNAQDLLETGFVEPNVAVQQTRVLSQALAMVVASQLDAVGSGTTFTDEALATLLAGVRERLTAAEALLGYLYRRHLAAAAERALFLDAMADAGGGVRLAVGFADVVGFTAATQQLDETELAQLVDTFAAHTSDVVAGAGGRVVKMIGDEIMFTSADALGAATIALRLLEGDVGGDLRVGVAFGPVLTRNGDVFGTTVNLASRLVDIAYPGSALVSEELAEAIGDDAALVVKAAPRRRLKGIGTVRPFRLRPGVEWTDGRNGGAD